MDDEILTEKLKQGDNAAFEELVRKYQNYIYKIVISMLRNEEDAEDVTQEVFVRIYTSISGFGEKASLSTWIYRIAYNMTLDHIKKYQKKRNITHSLDEPENPEIMSLQADTDIPEEVLERKELHDDIKEGLATLPEEQRVLIELKDVHGFSYEEILAMTGLKDGTLKSRLNRGRATLKKFLISKWNI